MKTEDIMNMMNHIDPALVEEVELTGRKKRRLSAPLRAGLIAACVCLALLGSALAVDAIWGVRVQKLEHENGLKEFNVVLDGVERIPVDSLPQEVVDLSPLREIIEFDSVEEAEKLLGISLPGFAPFQELEKTEITFGKVRPESQEKDYEELTDEDCDWYRLHCYLDRAGMEAPTVVSVTAQYTSNIIQRSSEPRELNKHYSPEKQQVIHFRVTALLYTDSYRFSSGGGIGWMDGEGVQMEQSSIITADGQEIPIFNVVATAKYVGETEETEEPRKDVEVLYTYADFLQDGVLYQVMVYGWRSENGQGGKMTTEILQAALESVLSGQPIAL